MYLRIYTGSATRSNQDIAQCNIRLNQEPIEWGRVFESRASYNLTAVTKRP